MRKICFVTGTRAEYGLLSRLMRMVKEDPSLELQIIATNMHLSPEFGLTYREIENDGLFINKKVEMLLSADSPEATAKSLGVELIGLADAYQDLQPDLLVILGDRYEMLGAATTALFSQIPIAHISGGDVTEGAYDDAIRHSITKMSHLHFASTETYRKRIIQLGEDPEKVFNTGSIAIDNMKNLQLLDREAFEASIGFSLGERNLLVTFHPATLETESSAGQFASLLEAIDESGCKLIFTKPNSDSGGRAIISMMDEYVSKNKDKAVSFASLGYLRYLSALQYVDAVVGNSSSGIVEVPSFHIPTVNIGDRQKGRLRASSVIDCKPNAGSISKALNTALSTEFKQQALYTSNPYELPDTAKNIFEIIRSYPLAGITRKHFYDLP